MSQNITRMRSSETIAEEASDGSVASKVVQYESLELQHRVQHQQWQFQRGADDVTFLPAFGMKVAAKLDNEDPRELQLRRQQQDIAPGIIEPDDDDDPGVVGKGRVVKQGRNDPKVEGGDHVPLSHLDEAKTREPRCGWW